MIFPSLSLSQSTECNSVFEYNVSSSFSSSRDNQMAHPSHPPRPVRGLAGRSHISASTLEGSHAGMDAMRIERRRKGHKRQVSTIILLSSSSSLSPFFFSFFVHLYYLCSSPSLDILLLFPLTHSLPLSLSLSLTSSLSLSHYSLVLVI